MSYSTSRLDGTSVRVGVGVKAVPSTQAATHQHQLPAGVAIIEAHHLERRSTRYRVHCAAVIQLQELAGHDIEGK